MTESGPRDFLVVGTTAKSSRKYYVPLIAADGHTTRQEEAWRGSELHAREVAGGLNAISKKGEKTLVWRIERA